MMNIETILAILLSVIALSMGVAVILARKIRTAILFGGAASLMTSIIYLLLSAPDVAMTEAAIGSGLTTIIFFYVINKIHHKDV